MAAPKKPSGLATPAELALVQLKNCLVNLPASIVSILLNANTVAQNVVVELTFRPSNFSSTNLGGTTNAPPQKSIYVGWTGLPSKRKLAPIVGRDGFGSNRGASVSSQQEVAVVEIDSTFARTLGVDDGQKVGVLLHLDPPTAHTVNIEPLTPADWEIIELHATFLELNMLSQIRALPNPSSASTSAGPMPRGHPLTVHLSPTSTASIVITSLSPPPPSLSPFAKISPDAEVIVAPKTRQRAPRGTDKESRSVASTSRKSAGGRSGASTVRRKDDVSGKGTLFLRGIDRGICQGWFDEDDTQMKNEGFKVWVDRDLISSQLLRGVSVVKVAIVKPAGLQEPTDRQQVQPQSDEASKEIKPSNSVIARIASWDDAPDSQHIALSSDLCSSLSAVGLVGGIIRIEPAPPQTSKNAVKTLKVYPFISESPNQREGIRFGGETKTEREEASHRIRAMFGRTPEGQEGLLDGPITDGLLLPCSGSAKALLWKGGIIKFDPQSSQVEPIKTPLSWFLGSDRKLPIEVQTPILKPQNPRTIGLEDGDIHKCPSMVAVDTAIEQLMGFLTHSSSVLIAGGIGSGKTSLAQLISYRLRNEYLYHTTFFSCQKLITDETRVSTIKMTFNRIFMAASWGARPTGKAVVILDDLDKLCPVETELQVGNDNSRSRQISEVICSTVKNYCSPESGVVLLATASSKETLNTVIVGGHIFREITALKAPDKEGRRRVLEALVRQSIQDNSVSPKISSIVERVESKRDDEIAWMEGSSIDSRSPSSSDGLGGYAIDKSLDFLHLAGQTDGYMPGDLTLLVSRARHEALISSVEQNLADSSSSPVQLGQKDFDRALENFTPASLRNVTLQTSTTTFDSIGGLHATRKTLLETLQYPTTYAPIFAQCPLRLRSGLLLYGYPGCGKTLLASAVAGECGLNFISVKGPEILNKYIGASEKSVRDLFERAEAARPCVLFFDEFDSIAPKRGHDSTGVTDRVVNQLLTQMDGAEGLTGVYVLAATSRPDLIDPALLRPGRLDKSLLCDLPNFEDRIDILMALSKKLKLAEDVIDSEALDRLADLTDGYSGADLQAVVSNAQLEAIHEVLDAQSDDVDGQNNGHGPSVRSKKGKIEKARIGSGTTKDFLQFRFGEEEDNQDIRERISAGTNRSKQIAELATISAKLENIRLARRNARSASQRIEPAGSGEETNGVQMTTRENQVVIKWKHIMKALKTTKSSIPLQERRRLEGIYREFIVGRNGEMPNGQGTTEVGGRSSLM